MITHHRRHILCPQLLIGRLGRCDRWRILPKQIREPNDSNWLQLAATNAGCAVAARAASYTAAAALAPAAAPSARAVAAFSQLRYGAAAAAIAAAAGPCHAEPGPAVRPEISN